MSRPTPLRPLGAPRPGPSGLARRLGSAGLLVGSLLLAGCGEAEPAAAYCEEVEAHQRELGEIVGQGGPTALLEALDAFRALRAESPRDLRDEWDVLVRRLEVLQEALDDAGVDAATYTHADPPDGLDREDRARIEAAARELVREPTVAALRGIEQQARDVCKTPLSL